MVKLLVMLLGSVLASCMQVKGGQHRVTAEGEARIVHVIQLDIDDVIRLCSRSNDEGQCISELVNTLSNNGILGAISESQ